MNSEVNAYVFVSADGIRRALSRFQDGSNLPFDYNGAWVPHDVVPLTLSGIEKYVPNSDVAMVNLIMRGYHLIDPKVVAFPRVRRRAT